MAAVDEVSEMFQRAKANAADETTFCLAAIVMASRHLVYVGRAEATVEVLDGVARKIEAGAYGEPTSPAGHA